MFIWCNEYSPSIHKLGFSVYDVSKVHLNSDINTNPPIHRRYRQTPMDEVWIKNHESTASIAAVKLSGNQDLEGQYLVALGKEGGREYGFYTAVNPNGEYNFVGSSKIHYWGENANIVTDCRTGNLYLFQIEETTYISGLSASGNADKVHLYKLLIRTKTPSPSGVQTFNIQFHHVKSRTFHCRGGKVDGAKDWCNFDAGAGIYVTPSGKLILYATNWHQSSDGTIQVVEFH